MTELYIGLMSGTSLDAIDAVLVELGGDTHTAMRLLARHTEPLPDDLRQKLVALNRPASGEIARMAAADVELGRLFGKAALTLCDKHQTSPDQVRAIGSHGQTIRHAPDDAFPYTLQIADPNTIAEITGITTVADLRRRDLSAGGQGAPLMPAFHNAMLRKGGETRVVLNIGGMANITILPADLNTAVVGFDTGPGNVLMDVWAQRHLGEDYDAGGKWASTGKLDRALLDRMLKDKYFSMPPPKSTGRDRFDARWLDKHLAHDGKRHIRKNVQATLCELTARTISQAILDYAANSRHIIVCGGGVHNTALMFRLQAVLEGKQVRSSEDYDIDPDWMEAIGFAWLAKQTLDNKPGNLPSVTGAKHPVVLGGIYL
jgi:anhydro-N-acetylmuramic acid kinase